MNKYKNWIAISGLFANLFCAAVIVCSICKFRMDWDTQEIMPAIRAEYNQKLLRIQYYSTLPVMASMMTLSAVLFWILRKRGSGSD